MNIKETFIQALEVISHNEEDFEIYRDKEVNNCTNTKAARRLCDGPCEDCIHNKPTKVDLLVVDAFDGTEHYYRFKGSKNKEKTSCTNITTQKIMFKEIRYFNECIIGQEQKEDLEYYEKLKKLRQYANVFFKELCDNTFSLLDSSILPIRFHMFGIDFEDITKEKQLGGQYLSKGKQNVVDVYYCYSTDIEKLKSSIRHEILHYSLDMENCACQDNTGIFWALCKVYDAGAYIPMDQEQQKYYDFFFKIYDTMPSELKFAVSTLGSKDEVIIQSRNKLVEILEANNSPKFVKDCLKLKNSYN